MVEHLVIIGDDFHINVSLTIKSYIFVVLCIMCNACTILKINKYYLNRLKASTDNCYAIYDIEAVGF